MVRRSAWMAAALLLLTAGIAQAESGITFNGTNVGGPTMTVPSSTTTLSGRTGRYSVQPFFPGPVSTTASCDIFGVQDTNAGATSDSVLLLYRGSFNPAAPLTNLIAYNDDANPGEVGVSRIEDESLSWVNDYYLVTVSYDLGKESTFSNHIECLDPSSRLLAGDGGLYLGDSATTVYDGRVAEVGGGRFQISVQWRNFSLVTGDAFAVPFGSTDSAIFWFFQPQNWEMLIKVLDGCGYNGRYWVFVAATTNVEFFVTVRDTRRTGTTADDVFYYIHNPLGTSLYTALQDINAFATCP